jgi:hypothetical protein
MGGKPRLRLTVALSARYHDLVSVVAGTTLGVLADVPAQPYFRELPTTKKVPCTTGPRNPPLTHFAALGVLALLNVGNLFWKE